MWDNLDYCGDRNRLERSEVYIWAGFQLFRSSQKIEAMKAEVVWKPGFRDRPLVKINVNILLGTGLASSTGGVKFQ